MPIIYYYYMRVKFIVFLGLFALLFVASCTSTPQAKSVTSRFGGQKRRFI